MSCDDQRVCFAFPSWLRFGVVLPNDTSVPGKNILQLTDLLLRMSILIKIRATHVLSLSHCFNHQPIFITWLSKVREIH